MITRHLGVCMLSGLIFILAVVSMDGDLDSGKVKRTLCMETATAAENIGKNSSVSTTLCVSAHVVSSVPGLETDRDSLTIPIPDQPTRLVFRMEVQDENLSDAEEDGDTEFLPELGRLRISNRHAEVLLLPETVSIKNMDSELRLFDMSRYSRMVFQPSGAGRLLIGIGGACMLNPDTPPGWYVGELPMTLMFN